MREDLIQFSRDTLREVYRVFQRCVDRSNVGSSKNLQDKESGKAAINKDDIVNLQILLARSNNIDDFMKNI